MSETIFAGPCDQNRRVRCGNLAALLSITAEGAVFDIESDHAPVLLRLSTVRTGSLRRSRRRDAAQPSRGAHLDASGRLVLSTTTHRLLDAPDRVVVLVRPDRLRLELWNERAAADWLIEGTAAPPPAGANCDYRWAEPSPTPTRAATHPTGASRPELLCAYTYPSRAGRGPRTH